jgi:taurine dioxygenase
MATVATRYDVSPLGDGLPFGATVSGLTLSMLADEAVRRSLYDLWIDKGVIHFHDGDASEEMHMELSRCFGPLEEHLFPSVRSESNSALTKIKFYPHDGSLYNVRGEQRGAWLPWHSDLVYSASINHGGILRPDTIPPRYGKTGFLCQIAAYERLPQSLRDRIEGLHVVYEITIDHGAHLFADTDDVECLKMAESGEAIQKRKFTYPRVLHPMVYTQERTGRKVLNVSPGFALGIYEDGSWAGDDLLHEVCEYCMDPELAYFHDWQEGDMVLWDNWRVLHCAEGVHPEDTRLMLRTTISGDYARGQLLGAQGEGVKVDI